MGLSCLIYRVVSYISWLLDPAEDLRGEELLRLPYLMSGFTHNVRKVTVQPRGFVEVVV